MGWHKVIDQRQVRDLFDYRDGQLYWRECKKGRVMNRPCGTRHPNGYTRISVTLGGKTHFYYLHRLVYLYHYGHMPNKIDHIDGDPSNNFIENLREATQQQNTCNVKGHKDSASGMKNIAWSKGRARWIVRVSCYGKTICRQFIDLELAMLVATELREKMHGLYARHS